MGIVSVNVKKIKASKSVGNLLNENYRDDKTAKHYDDGHRNIDVNQTSDNVFLIGRPSDYDEQRRAKIERVNEARAKRINPKLALKNSKKRLRENGKLVAEKNKSVASTRKLRSDVVDTLGIVFQPDSEFIGGLNRDEQVRFFNDALDVIKSRSDEFGAVETAVIHFDETTPHMQVLSSTIDESTLTSEASRIVGNKSKLSGKQDVIADGLKAKGWDVERGIKRIDNPDYRNFKSELEAQGLKVNRHNDAVLKTEWDKLQTAKSKTGATSHDLDDREGRLNARSAVLASQEERANDFAKKLNAGRATLNARSEVVNDKVEQVKRANLKVNQRTIAVNERETSLGVREASLDSREEMVNQKDLNADNKLKEASKLKLDTEKMIKRFEALRTQLSNRWNTILTAVRNGALKPQKVEEIAKKYTPVTSENVEQVADEIVNLDMSDLNDDNDLQL